MAVKFERWIVEHGRRYKDAFEENHCFKVFKKNIEFIESFIVEHQKFKLNTNQFTDITDEESRASCDGFKLSSIDNNVAMGLFKYENVIDMPESVDWSLKELSLVLRD